ncbi:crossover junction endodeoxyribonuclease RuvC [Sodalis-like secondary symbiont of Drepanosiphum platanoidis]|uniref:crossover junction endodeoxyribonuclease RuvC n=1 Tax=Sodalis-like secondary symbiont of Drepanosiphum platanoidis TaxID=2994493 RepID=UPI00346394F0
MSIILGLDPGSLITGYGIISYDINSINYITSGLIKINNKNILFRTNLICNYLDKIINKFKPDYCAIEKVFISNKNISSGLKLSQVKGAILFLITKYNIPVFEYSTCTIKNAIVGTGKATKKQIQYMIKFLLKISFDIKEDSSDALATAITYCHYN